MDAREPLRQPIPLARSILWAPIGAPRPGAMSFQVFLSQSALQAVYEHLAVPPPPGQGILGFLLGDRCECPVTGAPYVVIDAALRLTQTIYGDRSRDVVTRLWDRLDAQIRSQNAHLIGWYHTHTPLPLTLSPHDVETHEQHFREPWQVSVLLGTDADLPAGAFFLRDDGDTWGSNPQPFYELLSEESIRPGGKKRSFMTWKNYRAYNPPAARARPAAASPPPPAASLAPLEEPSTFEDSEQRDEPEEQVQEQEEQVEEQEEQVEEQGEQEEQEEQVAPEDLAQATEQEAAAERADDPNELKFLSAADDAPPPPPLRRASAPHAAPPLAPPPPPAPRISTPTPAPTIEWPEEPPEEEELVVEEAPAPRAAAPERRAPRRPRSRGGPRRRKRIVALALLSLLVAGGVAAWRMAPISLASVVTRFSRPARKHPAPPTEARRAPSPPVVTLPPNPSFARLDQAADALARAVQAFSGRVRLYESQRLDCLPLGRGIAVVERGVASYNAQRNAARAPLDSPRSTRDLQLRAAVDSAERRFQLSQCGRF